MQNTSSPNTSLTEAVGLVLIGGQSSRMGRDKALLEFQGFAMHEVMRQRLHAAGCDAVWLAGELPGLHGLADPPGYAGPLAGIAAVSTKLHDGERLLVVPVDMPRLSPGLLAQLLEDDAPVTRFEGYCLPLALTVSKALRDYLLDVVEQFGQTQSLMRLFDTLGGHALTLPASSHEQLANANTPEEWGRLLDTPT